MGRTIDCLFIGHNEMRFDDYQRMVMSMDARSGAYRDLNLNFITHEGHAYTATDIFNLFHPMNGSEEPLGFTNVFSATIAYLGTYLNRRGLSFDYVNSFREHMEELAAKLRGDDIIAVAIPTTLYVAFFPIMEIMSFIKKHNKNVKVIVGGPFIATQSRAQDKATLLYLFRTIGADFYVDSSEGEAALAEIIRALKENKGFDNINNIYYKDGKSYTSTSPSAENNRLEENMVDWKLFSGRLGSSVSIRTSKSCPFSCSFCGFPLHAGKYETAGIEAIEAELDSLAVTGSVKCLNIIDDTFNVPADRFKEFLRLLDRKKYNFRWNCNVRCQYLDRETVEMMKQTGCDGVFLGIESGSQGILENMNKHATVEEYRKGHALLAEYGMITYMSFIIGFPGETRKSVQETVNFIEETRPTFFRTQAWYCDPLTPIWKEKEKYGIRNSQFEWSHNTMDSKVACDLIEEIFLSVRNSIWMPQNNFELFSVFNMMNRGINIDMIKKFILAFNAGVREKIENPGKEASLKAIEEIKKICTAVANHPLPFL